MVTANNYMFQPLTGHHWVVHPMKRGVGGHAIYSVTSVYIVHCTAPQPPISLDVQPDDGLKHVVVSCYHRLLYIYIYIYFSVALRPDVGHGVLIFEVSRSHTTTTHHIR